METIGTTMAMIRVVLDELLSLLLSEGAPLTVRVDLVTGRPAMDWALMVFWRLV